MLGVSRRTQTLCTMCVLPLQRPDSRFFWLKTGLIITVRAKFKAMVLSYSTDCKIRFQRVAGRTYHANANDDYEAAAGGS